MNEILSKLVIIFPYRDKINYLYLRLRKKKLDFEAFEECFLHIVDSEVEKETHIVRKKD